MPTRKTVIGAQDMETTLTCDCTVSWCVCVLTHPHHSKVQDLRKIKNTHYSPIPSPPLFTHVHPLHSHSITKNCKQGTLDGSKQKWGQTREISDDNTPTWNQEFTKTNQASTYFESTSCLHFRVDDIDPGTDDNLFTMIEWTPNSASTWDAGTYGKFGSYGTVRTARTSDGQLLRYQLQIWASNCDAGYGNVDKTWYVFKCTHSQPDGVPRTH